MATDQTIQRQSDLKLANHFYDWHAPYGDTVCVYCGEYATSQDHVAPISYVAALGDAMEHMRPMLRHSLLIVPACRDCNNRLASYVGRSLTEKRAELKRRLRRKYRRLLESYDWQDEEIAELGRNLQSWIRNQEARRIVILRRLSFPERGSGRLLRVLASMGV